MEVDFRILGPLEAAVAGEPVPLGGGKQRALLALLLLRANAVVLSDRLTEDLWAGDPPARAAAALHVYVSRMRKVLPAGTLVTGGGGYRLAVDPDCIDAQRFVRLLEDGRGALAAEDAETAARVLGEALALWRGPALADVAYEPFAQPEIARLEDLRMVAIEERIEADLACGRAGGLVGELEALVGEHPLRERLRGQLMLSLYRSGRQADALAAYRKAREALVEELGIEPGVDLRELEARILAQDPALAIALAPAPATPAIVPAPRQPRPAGNLPPAATSFVGRDRELGELRELVARERLITIHGPGGAGKTRLALRAAEELAPAFDNGAWLIDLAPVTDTALIWSAIAAVLDVPDVAGGSLAERVLDALARMNALLVLDNCEHVVAAVRDAAGAMLDRCQGIRFLATTREQLDVAGELVWSIPAMSDDAVRLFAERAGRTLHGFVLDQDDAGVAARICRRLDGMPLAIELAAARVDVLSVQEIEERLADRFRLLTRGSRSAPARHQTLRAAVEWGYELLTQPERSALARASVFAGGFGIDAAEHVLADGGVADHDVLDLVSELTAKSLIARYEAQKRARYRLHETIREYTAERLQESGEADAVRRRHADHFLVLAEAAEPHLWAESREWYDRLEREHDNLLAALDWLQSSGDVERALRLTAAVFPFWQERGHVAEGRRRVESLLRADDRPTAARANALTGAAALAIDNGDATTARSRAEEALALHRDLADVVGVAGALLQLGAAIYFEGDFARMQDLLEESIRLFREVGEDQRALTSSRCLAWAFQGLGEGERERELHEHNLRWARDLGNERIVASTLGALAMIVVREGRPAEAIPLLLECHEIHRDRGDVVWNALNLCRLAHALALAGRPRRAALLLSSSHAVREEMGVGIPWLGEMNEQTLAAIHDQLDDGAFAEAWEQGCALRHDDAFTLALDLED